WSTAPPHPYTTGLLSGLPSLQRGRERLIAIEGQPPDLAHVPPGCGFAPRCALAEPRCVEARPSLDAVAPDHLVACVRAVDTDGPAGRARCAPVAATPARPDTVSGHVVLEAQAVTKHFAVARGTILSRSV